MIKKQTSAAMSKLASDILAGRVIPTGRQIRSLAACVLSQDETPSKPKAKAKRKVEAK